MNIRKDKVHNWLLVSLWQHCEAVLLHFVSSLFCWETCLSCCFCEM